jgi:hypothetical protein
MPFQKDAIAMNAILLILAFIEVIVAIWASVICCAGVCCGTATPGVVYPGGQVQYINAGQSGQVMMMTSPAMQQQGMMVTQPQQTYYVQQGPAMQGQYAGQQAMAPPPYSTAPQPGGQYPAQPGQFQAQPGQQYPGQPGQQYPGQPGQPGQPGEDQYEKLNHP